MSTVTTTTDFLRIAVPNKGSLSEPASEMLREAGYRQRHDSRELVLQDPDNGVEFFFLRPRDIAIYVGSGRLDVGITGEDLLLDSGARLRGDGIPEYHARPRFSGCGPDRAATEDGPPLRGEAGLRRLDLPVRSPGRFGEHPR